MLQRLRRLPWFSEQLRPEGDVRSDTALLTQLQKQPDEAAFAAIVERHGPMVLGVCSRYLRQTADIEDAYQAVFLVLLRSLQRGIRQQCLGAWLHEVARRTALHAASRLGSQQNRQQVLIEEPAVGTEPIDSVMKQEVRAILDEEVDNLPLRYRMPIVLCHLQGRSKIEAAAELGWPTGTVSGRLARGKELLRSRLVKRGIAPAVALGIVQQSSIAFTGMTISLNALLTVTNPTVKQLAQGILSMWAIRTKLFWTSIVFGLLLMAGTTGAGAYWLLQPSPLPGNVSASTQPNSIEWTQSDAKDLDGLWLEVQRDEVTNEILFVNRLFIKEGKYKLLLGVATTNSNGFPSVMGGGGVDPTNYKLIVDTSSPAHIDFYGNLFGSSTRKLPAGQEKVTALYALNQDKLKLYFYFNADGVLASLPPNVSAEKPQPADTATRLLVRTFQRETPEYVGGKLKPPSTDHPLLRTVQAEPATPESSKENDELLKLLELRAELYQKQYEAGKVMSEEPIRAKLEVLRARLNHPKTTMKEKQQLVAECMKSIDTLGALCLKKYEAGTATQMELADAQIALLKARIEFKQYLKSGSK
ncbi:MAG: RNA polymerase sigma factor [Gemmatales bacterium]